MRKNKMTHQQRRNSCARKTWTKAERFQNRLKNAARLAALRGTNPMIKQLLDEAAKELAHEAEHVHGEGCHHDDALEHGDGPGHDPSNDHLHGQDDGRKES